MEGPAVVVRGQRELSRAFAKADRETRLEWRRTLRQLAEPVRSDAEQLALQTIRNMPKSPKWARMRTGVTQKLVYVAPRQKGTRGRGRGRRPNLADLLMDRAMQPALDRHRGDVERAVELLFDGIADDFNRGGRL
ncbi:MAG: hypothetical protein E6J91_45795 [Deltaproteobacteria bacterium]|nr:MAG: hypothetical protein E6J91_45795 [Deltaproteobacteria bacterium]